MVVLLQINKSKGFYYLIKNGYDLKIYDQQKRYWSKFLTFFQCFSNSLIQFSNNYQEIHKRPISMHILKLLITILLLLLIAPSIQDQYSRKTYPQTSENEKIAQQCEQKCYGADTCKKDCIDEQIRKINSAQNLGIGLGCFLTFILLIVTVLLILNRPCLCCPNHFYNKYRRNYNQIDRSKVSLQQFERLRSEILSLLSPKDKNYQFYFQFNSKMFQSRIEKVKITSEEDFIIQLKLSGTDESFGQWEAFGYIVQKEAGIKFWMYKVYNKKTLCKFEHIIYKSDCLQLKAGLKGFWGSFEEQERQNNDQTQEVFGQRELRGKWEIIKKFKTQIISDSIKTSNISLDIILNSNN